MPQQKPRHLSTDEANFECCKSIFSVFDANISVVQLNNDLSKRSKWAYQ